jgi:CheY-like chemotaxis protein
MTDTHRPPLQVYLIDDDPDHLLLIKRAITQTHPETVIRVFEDGSTALAALYAGTVTPDLILLDINMAGVSGFEVLMEIKADPRWKRVPVVMLTSSTANADVARAYELGASGYISKPSVAHDLRAVLGNTLLYWSAMQRATAQGAA